MRMEQACFGSLDWQDHSYQFWKPYEILKAVYSVLILESWYSFFSAQLSIQLFRKQKPHFQKPYRVSIKSLHVGAGATLCMFQMRCLLPTRSFVIHLSKTQFQCQHSTTKAFLNVTENKLSWSCTLHHLFCLTMVKRYEGVALKTIPY